MINLITEDGNVNQQLSEFPAANGNISIFGTQSSGKSTLINAAFNTYFPVLNTKETRTRCTKGVWFQHVQDFNIIDTEGFDSVQRKNQEKILEKQIALFCLAISDVVIINLWMNEVGRYEGSHSHILRSVIRVSERLISSQQKKIIFVVKDCTEDADRRVLREELSLNVNSIVNSETINRHNSVKLNIEYHFMSHYFYKRSLFQKEARELKNMIKVRKSHLSNYSAQDRLEYINTLWEKITSAENEIDLKSVEDALRQHALDRIKAEAIAFAVEEIKETEDLTRHKTLERFANHIRKEAEKRFLSEKPHHIPEKQVDRYLLQMSEQLEYPIMKHFNEVILPLEQQKLLNDFENSLKKDENSRKLEKILIKKKKDLIDLFKKMIAPHKETLSLVKHFSEKISEVSLQYERKISHLFNMFQNTLEKELNDELDRQLWRSSHIYFDGQQIDKKIKKVCTEFQYNEWEINFKDMWEKISHRSINQKLPERIEQLSTEYMESASIFTGDRTTSILAFHKRLEKDCEGFSINVANYFEEEAVIYHPMDKVKEQIELLMEKALIKERTRFHLTLLITSLFMWFFYSEFFRLLKFLAVKKKKRRYWMYFYTGLMVLFIILAAYNKRRQIQRFFAGSGASAAQSS